MPTESWGATPATVDPTTRQRHRLLRAEVGRLRLRESRRVFDGSVHVGRLGTDDCGFVVRAQDLPAFDTALRVDVLTALLEATPPSWHTTWLVRPGTPEQHDHDLQWLSAARTAFGIHGRPLDGCFVITRTGWRDVLSDEQRAWVRLRL